MNVKHFVKKTLLLILMVFLPMSFLFAQQSKENSKKKLYNPSEDAAFEISKAVNKAAIEGKHVFLQIGGNWCGWCISFNKKVNTEDVLKNSLDENFTIYHVNYSKENKNENVLASLGYPQRFGFPVFVILDGKGNRIHTQNSAYLEEGKGHSTDKILKFFEHWSPKALDLNQYNQN
jgi:thioredoxin-related protein